MESTPSAPAARPGRPDQDLRLLLIDPQPENRSLLKGALRSLNYVASVMERGSAHGVLDVLRETPVDVVLVEEHLEQDDPFRVVRQIKGLLPGASFVLMSRQMTVESRRQGIEVGIQGYLSKPFDLQSLEKALRDARGRVSTNIRDTLDKVRRISFFSEFTDQELVRLLKICHTRKYSAGESIFHEGDHGDRLYVLLSGDVAIMKHIGDEARQLAVMKPGDVFGEMAIVDASPRSADAVARTDCMMIEVHDQIINNLEDPLALKLFRKFAILVTKKLRDYTREVGGGIPAD